MNGHMTIETLNRRGSESKIECRGLATDEKALYLEFARRAWGTRSPQAEASFLDWLYKENPYTLGINRDLLVLVGGDQILGAHHRMRVPWSINGERSIVPSLHDLCVLPGHRAGGGGRLVPPGLQLMLTALEKENHVALFGLTPMADKIYERMGIPVIRLFWMQKIRSLVRAGVQMAASRLGWSTGNFQLATRRTFKLADYEVLRTGLPTSEELAEALTVKPSTKTYPDWDMDSFRWRFFHELGPRNILFLARSNGKLFGRAVVSLGLKNGVIVARIVNLVFEQSECLDALSEGIEHTFSEMRVAVCLVVTDSQVVTQRFREVGWDYRKETIGARWFTRKGEVRPQDFSICGGAWDFGCDSRIGH